MIDAVKFLESFGPDRTFAQGSSSFTLLNPANDDLPAEIIQVAGDRRWPVFSLWPPTHD